MEISPSTQLDWIVAFAYVDVKCCIDAHNQTAQEFCEYSGPDSAPADDRMPPSIHLPKQSFSSVMSFMFYF